MQKGTAKEKGKSNSVRYEREVEKEEDWGSKRNLRGKKKYDTRPGKVEK